MMTPQTEATMKAPESGVKVRMYDLKGEGDCFLLAFRAKDDTDRYMLIDCGIFLSTSHGADRLRDVAKDIAKATGYHLHVLVVTHEHWDHLVGFNYAKKTFCSNKMKIDEVWLAWTENLEEDQLAKDLHQKYEAGATALAAAAKQLKTLGDPSAGPITSVLAQHLDFDGELGVNTNELMNNVHKELSGHPARYCYPGNPSITLPGVPGLRFYVLGPPRDESSLKKLEVERALHGEPPALDKATSFYAAVLAAFRTEALEAGEQAMYERMSERSRPFRLPLGMTSDKAQAYKVGDKFFFREHYGFVEEDPEKDWRRIDNDWLATAGQLALHMDDYTNNTSLVLALELIPSRKVLLFPGDAQFGNWLSWENTKWTIEDENGEAKVIKGMNLIQRTVFYKVGHHGSHNGTLVEYLKQMRDDLVAMIPVNQKWANEKKNWEHPGKALLEELKKKTRGRIIRADTRLPDVKPTGLSQDEWKEFQDNVKETQLWIEYTVLG